MSHIPTPYQIHDHEHCPLELWGNLEGPMEDGQIHGTHVLTVEDGPKAYETAGFVLRACNSHDALVAACKAWVDYFEKLDADNPNDPLAEARRVYHGKRLKDTKAALKGTS